MKRKRDLFLPAIDLVQRGYWYQNSSNPKGTHPKHIEREILSHIQEGKAVRVNRQASSSEEADGGVIRRLIHIDTVGTLLDGQQRRLSMIKETGKGWVVNMVESLTQSHWEETVETEDEVDQLLFEYHPDECLISTTQWPERGRLRPIRIVPSWKGSLEDYFGWLGKDLPQVQPRQSIPTVLMDAQTRLNLLLSNTTKSSLLRHLNTPVTLLGKDLLHRRLKAPLTCPLRLRALQDKVQRWKENPKLLTQVRLWLQRRHQHERKMLQVFQRCGKEQARDYKTLRIRAKGLTELRHWIEAFRSFPSALQKEWKRWKMKLPDFPPMEPTEPSLKEEREAHLLHIQASYPSAQWTSGYELGVPSHIVIPWEVTRVTKKTKFFRTPQACTLLLQAKEIHLQARRTWAKELTRLEQAWVESGTRVFLQQMAEWDVTIALAQTSLQQHWTRPSWHPTQCHLKQMGFQGQVKNDVDLTRWVLTGSNASGKSTLMRTVAQVIILAQMGSDIPCALGSQLPIFHSIGMRFGHFDSLKTGESSFVVEMKHMRHLMTQMRSPALLLIDELGATTSARYGAAIAHAAMKWLFAVSDPLYAIFSTHYHRTLSTCTLEHRCMSYPITYQVQQGDQACSHALAVYQEVFQVKGP